MSIRLDLANFVGIPEPAVSSCSTVAGVEAGKLRVFCLSTIAQSGGLFAKHSAKALTPVLVAIVAALACILLQRHPDTTDFILLS